jgi:hypothetical protein
MMKLTLALTLAAVSALAQAPAPQLPVSNVSTASLPPYLVGTGVEWDRAASVPLSNVTSLAVQLGSGSSWYWWNTFSTPLAGAQLAANGTKTYLPTSIRTGMAYVAAQSASGKAFLGFLVDGGFANTQSAPPSGANALAYSTGVFLAFQPAPHLFLMPILRATGTTLPASVTGTNSSLQMGPEFMAFYSFGGSR